MSIAVLALLAWLVLIVFAIVPKGLTLSDIVFLYFLIGIITITLFTILDVNLHWVPLTRSVEGAFAMYIDRFIIIPFAIILSVCILNSHLKAIWRWGLSATIVLFLCVVDRICIWADLITFQRWNEFFAVVMYVAFIVLVWWILLWFLGLEKGEFKNS
ncbi:hypothetical protein [Heyndrickxia camelliae]|uniref:Uncharacterized protein n=1 Tax=Heyndrickxia camelliae TaxID=1707093 RepID=A0A2N3LLH7_9BACI|nr:hypothetical protein [Heyndrickxia camelliae]PKR85404.1 hypothetical protein CWO92_09470 [Heyndrickxia camelliae]